MIREFDIDSTQTSSLNARSTELYVHIKYYSSCGIRGHNTEVQKEAIEYHRSIVRGLHGPLSESNMSTTWNTLENLSPSHQSEAPSPSKLHARITGKTPER